MGYLKEVNIKYDMPTADLAVRRTTYAIENGRTLGASAVKLIHGYGSTGKGGQNKAGGARVSGAAEGARADKGLYPRRAIFDFRRAYPPCVRPLRRAAPRPRP